jgi:precorrin-6B methylase 2
MENHSSRASSFQTLAPFNPSSDQIQEKALKLLQLQEKEDVLFDIGCGDARFLCTAVQTHPHLRCVGIEIDPHLVQRANENIHNLPSPHMRSRIEIRLQDATEPMPSEQMPHLTLLNDATALYLFILPKGIQTLMPTLEQLVQTRIRQNRRFQILSYMFRIHEWEPTVIDRTAKGACPIYYYEWTPKTTT